MSESDPNLAAPASLPPLLPIRRVRPIDAKSPDLLPAEQRQALELLVQGRSVAETAQSVGIARRTIYNWLQKDPTFQTAYNQWHQDMKENCRTRLLMLTGKATAALAKALEAGDANIALQLLKGIGMLTPTPDRPTDEDEVRKQADLDEKLRRAQLKKAEIDMRADLASAKMAHKMLSGKS